MMLNRTVTAAMAKEVKVLEGSHGDELKARLEEVKLRFEAAG